MYRFLILIYLFLSTQILLGQAQSSRAGIGLTTIQGNIKNYEIYYGDYNQVEVMLFDWATGSIRKIFLEIDLNGNFTSSFLVLNAQPVFLNYKESGVAVFVAPNDTISASIDANLFPEATAYNGSTEQATINLNEYYALEKDHTGLQSSDDYEDFSSYKAWRETMIGVELHAVENYIHANSSDTLFNLWLRTKTQLEYLIDLVSYGFIQPGGGLRRDSQITTIDKYFEVLKLNNSISFKYCPQQFFSLINALHIPVQHLASKQMMLESLSERQEQYNSDPEGNLILESKTYSQEETLMRLFPYVIDIASYISDSIIRESIIVHTYTRWLEANNIDVGLDWALRSISNPEIQNYLIAQHNHYQKRKSDQASIQPNSPEKNILENLKAKYPEHVLYIDIWGTWCPSCYTCFEGDQRLKKELKGEKVAFIYLCYKCNEEKWQETIVRYDLEGEHLQLSNEDYIYLHGLLNIWGVPRFFIVNSSGIIVNDHAPAPTPGINDGLQLKATTEILKYAL